MRALYVSDRLSVRGGADLHLLAVLQHTAGHLEPLLAVGRCEIEPRCQAVELPGLARPMRAPVWSDLEALCARFRPDVIHIHNALNPEALEWGAHRGAVATVHDHRCFCPGRGKLTLAGAVCHTPMTPEVCAGCFDDADYFRQIYARTKERLRALRKMARIIVLSRYMRDELVDAGADRKRIAIISPFVNGLDADATPSGRPCVLFAGRLVRAKGVDDAVQAWRASGLDLPLVFAGTGPERARLEARGATVLGWQPVERMSGVYRRAAALVMPSRWQEPFGIAGLEALHMGVPVAAWRSGGIPEWLPGAVEWGQVDALAAALLAAAGTRVEPPSGFGREASIARLLVLYHEVASDA